MRASSQNIALNKIAIIISEWQRPFIHQLFHDEKRLRLYENKFPETVHQLRYFAERVHLIVQREQKGYGHAVLQAKDSFDKESPIMVLLGDHIYISSDQDRRNCMLQMIDGYMEMSQYMPHFDALTSVDYCAERHLGINGVLTGDFVPLDDKHQKLHQERGILSPPKLIRLTDTVEKPHPLEARKRLYIHDEQQRKRLGLLEEDQYLCYFGIEILPFEIFTYLEELLEQLPEDEELNLRLAQHRLIERMNSGMAGLLMHGHRLDTGLPFDYLQSMNVFHENERLKQEE